MKQTPLETKIKDLPDGKREIMKIIIRNYCKNANIYKDAHAKGIGLETTEELVEKLLDSGDLVVSYKDKEKSWIRFDGSNLTIIGKLFHRTHTISVNPWFVRL